MDAISTSLSAFLVSGDFPTFLTKAMFVAGFTRKSDEWLWGMYVGARFNLHSRQEKVNQHFGIGGLKRRQETFTNILFIPQKQSVMF